VWKHRDALPLIAPREGIEMRILSGDRLQLSFVTLQPGAIVPMHAHPNEQAGYVLEGVLTLQVGDEIRDLEAGQSYLIPANVPHEGTSAVGCLVLDVFSPPRADYTERARQAAE
jgi:quercetin dioxygenase-like cupin family protein